MGALDFTELPSAASGASRDIFELFAREFLVEAGYEVAAGPDRGADGGRDLIVVETRIGPGGMTQIRWLVSCKHYSHGGKSVTPGDEGNIRDRLETHSCNGFMPFYSTLPSSGLGPILEALKQQYEVTIYDPEHIERLLLNSPGGRVLAARFMPTSFKAWIRNSQHAQAEYSLDPQLIRNTFFLREPHSDLSGALAEAAARKLLVFVVIYDPKHSTLSKLNYALGCFMEYETTKRLVDENFVALVGPSSDPALSELVPEDDPLESCLWVVLDLSGSIIRREQIYANPDEGMKRVREVIRTLSLA
jgi:hypothetical protein